MSTPVPSAPPFLATYYFESKIEPTAFEIKLYLRETTNYVDSMAKAIVVLNAYLPLMVPDIHCLKLTITDGNPAVKGDSWVKFFLTGEKAGTYAPTSGSDLSALDYQTGIQTRWQNTSTGVHETRHIRPVPRTLVLDGKTLTPDTAYTDALADWDSAVSANVLMVTKSPGGTPLQSIIHVVVDNYHVVRVPGGEPHFMKRGRARTPTVVPA